VRLAASGLDRAELFAQRSGGPSMNRKCIAEQFGNHYQLRDANSDRVVLDNVTFDEPNTYLLDESERIGQPVTVTQVQEFVANAIRIV
jgi:hypothetical protein